MNWKNFLKKEFVLGLIAVIFGLIAVGTLVWVLIKHPTENVCGERFILDEFIIPYISTIKPITLIVFSAFICWICGLESLKSYLSKIPIIMKTLIFLGFCFLAFLYSYEVIWNFFAWSEAYILTGGTIPIDLISHLPSQTNPKALCPTNLVFTTKTQFLVMGASFYAIYFFHELIKNNVIRNKHKK